MAIRLISPQQLDLYHFDAACRKYDAQYPELEKAVENLPSFVERISKEVAELPKQSSSRLSFNTACESIQTNFSTIERIKRHIRTLSQELQKIYQQMDPATDPFMQKIRMQFPALMEQLEKISMPSFENHQYQVLHFFNKVEGLKTKMEKSAERVSAVTRQFEQLQKEYAQRGTRSTTSTPKSEKSPGNPFASSAYYSPLNPAFASLPLYSPGFQSGILPSPFLPPPFSLGSRSTSRAPSRPSSRTGFQSSYPSSPVKEEVPRADFEQPKSGLRIDTRSRIPKSLSNPSFYDLDYDSDGYERDKAIAAPPSRVKTKSKSWEGGLDSALRSADQDIERELESAMRAKPLYSTENYYNEYGMEGSDLNIHIRAIHERAVEYRELSPNHVEYSVFRTQLEYTSVRAQKIADTVEQGSSEQLETLFGGETTLRAQLREVIIDLNAIDQAAQHVMRSASTQRKWEGGLLQLGQFCRVIVGASTTLQRIIDQGEAIWSYVKLVKLKAREFVITSKVASVCVPQLEALVQRGVPIDNLLQTRCPIYYQQTDTQPPDVILDGLTLMEVVEELAGNLRVIKKSCSTPAIRKEVIYINFKQLVKNFTDSEKQINRVVKPWVNTLNGLSLLPGVLNSMVLKYALAFYDGEVQPPDL